MYKIEAIVRPDKLEEIKEALNNYKISGLTVTPVMGCGHQKGHKEYYRGAEIIINLLPKIKLEIVIKDEELEKVLAIISENARTGEIGDGKIFIFTVQDALRIRTGERGDAAI